ncbi:MAG: RecX family transcriptional regulator [Treponema sp.]|nr:RecX family transcriptional regulator [Treponema sp.]
MTIVSLKIGAEEDLRRAESDCGSVFAFRLCYLPPPFSFDDIDGLEGRELGEAEQEALSAACECLRAEGHALRMIARAEQTAFSLGMKLARRGFGRECSGAVVDRLRDLGLVDDRRFSGLWTQARAGRQATSPLRLFAGLSAKGVDREDARAAIDEALSEEAEMRLLERFARKVSGKLCKGAQGQEEARRALRRALKSEGFSPGAIAAFFEE